MLTEMTPPSQPVYVMMDSTNQMELVLLAHTNVLLAHLKPFVPNVPEKTETHQLFVIAQSELMMMENPLTVKIVHTNAHLVSLKTNVSLVQESEKSHPIVNALKDIMKMMT
jgi:hypothetical protein